MLSLSKTGSVAGPRETMTALARRKPGPDLFTELRDALAGLVPDPKRRSRADGVDGWYPYYAGFSSSFAVAALQAVPGTRVLDPWNGSGTTTTAAAHLGLTATGVDLSPFACLIAQAKAASFGSAKDALALGHRSIAGVRTSTPSAELKQWMPASVAAAFESIAKSILNGSSNWPPAPQQAFALLCLIRAARIVAPPKGGSNPTWFRPPARRKRPRRALAEVFIETIAELATDEIGAPKVSPTVLLGDARRLPVQSSTIDVVLTSPPYCTRIDYAASTAFELACLRCCAGAGDLGDLRRELMGTTMIRERTAKDVPVRWANGVKSLLEQVRSHRSYASGVYYFKNFWQYFSDADSALGELSRVLRPGGVAAMVLQTSFYKEILIDLPNLYLEMAGLHEMTGAVVVTRTLPSSRVMASLKPKARTPKQPRRYEESIVLLERK